jgi:hypothetical protein
MAHTVMFDWRLHGKPERLSVRIGAVAADASTAAAAIGAVPALPKADKP